MKFYTPDGSKELTKEEFIATYSEMYFEFRGNEKDKENRIIDIIKKDSLDRDDIIDLLCWKTGVERDACDETVIKWYGRTIRADALIQEIQGQKWIIENPEDVFDALAVFIKHKGIGPVIAITLLFFMSKGEYPIYDRHAAKAVQAILKGQIPGEAVEYSYVPDVNKNVKKIEKQVEKVMNGYKEYEGYKKYIKDLESIFGDEYKLDRRIDQALWAYGKKCFKKK